VEERVPDFVALALRAIVDLSDVRRTAGDEPVAGAYEVGRVEQPVCVRSGHRVVAIVPDTKTLDQA